MKALSAPSLNRYWQTWLSRRLPANSEITLAHKSIFILPTGFGLFWLLLVVVLFLFGTNYQNNLVIGLSLLLLSVFNTCIIYSYRNLAGMTLQAKIAPNVYAGETVLFPIEISAPQVQCQVRLSYKHNPIRSIERVDEHKQLILIAIDNARRGWLDPGRLKVESRFPLGLCRAWSHIDLDNRQIVFAAPKVSHTALKRDQENKPADSLQGSATIGVEEFKHLRPYVIGEPLNQIAWKQLAQGRGMLTKEFDQPTGEPQWLVFDPTRPDLEQQLSELTWMVDTLSQHNKIFGLRLPAQTLLPGCGNHHRVACLKAIATYGPTTQTGTQTGTQAGTQAGAEPQTKVEPQTKAEPAYDE